MRVLPSRETTTTTKKISKRGEKTSATGKRPENLRRLGKEKDKATFQREKKNAI